MVSEAELAALEGLNGCAFRHAILHAVACGRPIYVRRDAESLLAMKRFYTYILKNEKKKTQKKTTKTKHWL